MTKLRRFGYWLAVLAGINTVLTFTVIFILIMLADQVPVEQPIPDHIEQWTIWTLWWTGGGFAAALVGFLCYGMGSSRIHLPRFMIHRYPNRQRWMWRRIGVWHGDRDGSPVLKWESSWRTIMAVYIGISDDKLLVFQWRGFRREGSKP